METAIVSLICIALLIFGGMTMSQGFMTSVDASTTGLSEIGQSAEAIMRTMLTPVDASLSLPGHVEIILENTGQTKMADFEKWDVIIQYYDDEGGYNIIWLPFNPGGATTNQWGVGWIRLNGETETFEPNVLNPGEQIMIEVELNPSVGEDTTNMVVISTPSGITCSTYFSP
jgi:flagellar protein FlaF